VLTHSQTAPAMSYFCHRLPEGPTMETMN